MLQRSAAALSVLVAAVGALSYACTSSADSASALGGDGGVGTFDGAVGPSADAAEAVSPNLKATDNGVIIVHAGSIGSFRLCFENNLDILPQPDSTVMPEANVVGVEIGSAVRIPPLSGVPGKVFLFEESLIRGSYPAFGGAGKGPTCRSLLESAATSPFALAVGTIDQDFSHNVHLAVIRGCPKTSPVRTYTQAECGADYLPDQGNLRVTASTLTATPRTATDTLPAQVIHLSQAVESFRAGTDLKVVFGALGDAGAHQSVARGLEPFGAPAPAEPVKLAYAPDATASFASSGFRVELVEPSSDVGPLLFEQSLADIQKLSSPRDVPPTYFAQASNYVLLLLGDPAPKLSDGGPDNDVLRRPHFLAVPVLAPQQDAGADAAPVTTADGG